MHTDSNQLIDDLLKLADNLYLRVQQFKTLSHDQLNHKPDIEKWSILECIEHLNLYGDFYLPEIEQRIMAQKPISGSRVFKSGWLGNYFANLMRAEAKPGKMKSTQR